jgi:uncharacterized protein YkwD
LLVSPASVVADAGHCVADDTLSAAAASLLLLGRTPSPDELVAAVRDVGSDAVLVRALHLRSDDDAQAQAWLNELRAHADAALICGDARGSAGRLLLAAPRAGTLAPLNARSSVVRGSLSAGFTRAELVVSDAAGHLQRLGVEPSMLVDGVPLADDLPRPATIQLLAHGPLGPRPVAERVLPAREPSAASARVPTLDAKPSSENKDASLFSLLRELRRSRGSAALRPNRLLDQVAQTHARDVCESGRIAHELSPGADPQARLLESGIQARLVGETVARAVDAATAFSQLGDSPSHLLTLLEPRFTDAGSGTATDDAGRTCIVVLLAAWPRYVGH